MEHITAFSFGYHGWGNATRELVRAVDAVERERGFHPPLFVDCRFNRAVRAKGFVGNAFGELLGPHRYRWMKGLGNEQIGQRDGPRIRIHDPSAARELRDLILAFGRDRRVIFFCGCPWPKWKGRTACHRTTIGALLLCAARYKGVRLEVVEWPGGKPGRYVGYDVPEDVFRAIAAGRMSIPVPAGVRLADAAGLPAGSIATLLSNGEELHRIIGPAIWRKEGWRFPVLWQFDDPAAKLADYRRKAAQLRRDCGCLSRISR